MTIDPSLLQRDMEIIRKKRGEDAIRMSDQVQERTRIFMPEFPTLMAITCSDGVAGIPLGAVTRIYGTPSAGKTQLAYWIIRAAQQMGISCIYWNVEGQFDEKYVKSIGVDTAKLVLRDTDVIEYIAEEMEILLSSVQLHVIDSASFATSLEQLAAKPSEWRQQRGIHAAAWKSAIGRIHHRMDKSASVVIVIDHEVVDQQGHSAPLSGQRMAFRSDLSIQMSRGAWLFYDEHGELVTNDVLKEKSKYGIGAAGLKQADGSEVSIRIAKSRVCRPFRNGKMRLDLHKMRFDRSFELAEFAKFLDHDGQPAHRSGKPAIARGNSSWFELPDGSKVHGQRGLRTHIGDHPELQEIIMSAMLRDS
jgi:RecA/RadA recombinase